MYILQCHRFEDNILLRYGITFGYDVALTVFGRYANYPGHLWATSVIQSFGIAAIVVTSHE